MAAIEAFLLGAYFATVFGLGWWQRNSSLMCLTTALGFIGALAEWADATDGALPRLTRDLSVVAVFALGTLILHYRADPYSKIWPWNWKIRRPEIAD